MNTPPKNILPPFAVQHSSQFPEFLNALNCTIAITTYQAGKVLFISAKNADKISILGRNFNKPMGLAFKEDKLAVACKEDLVVLKNSTELAMHYPNKPGVYDSLYMPRATYYTGRVDIHDIEWGVEGLWAVNTSFSCLCLVNDDFSFEPKWTPPFVTELTGEDRCHLNGLVLVNGKPKYVTALGTSNTLQGWREHITNGGILMDVETNEIIADQLPMPHSPCLINGKIYMLLSASGEFICLDPENGEKEVIKNLNGFCRGLSIVGDYAFIGMSKLRKNSSTFSKLPFSEKATFAGVKVVHIPTKSIVGEVSFENSVDEIYDVAILPNTKRPNILNTENELHYAALHLPNSTFWASGKEKD